MSESKRIGGVTVTFNDDGTLFIYQPDSSRVMGPELAEQLFVFLRDHLYPILIVDGDAISPAAIDKAVADFSTVPAGVINTSEGAAEPSVTTPIPAGVKNGDILIVGDQLRVVGEDTPAPVPRRRGRPPKAQA